MLALQSGRTIPQHKTDLRVERVPGAKYGAIDGYQELSGLN